MTLRLAWLVVLTLAGGLVAELAWPGPDTLPAARLAPVPAAAGVAGPADVPVGAWVLAALTRPLFSPNRRPATAAVAIADAPAGLPRLTGILVTEAGRRAIFAAPSAGARGTVLAEGGSLGAWRVEAIRSSDVTVAGPEGRRTVRPAYSEAPPPPAPAGLQLPPPLPPDTRAPNAPLNLPVPPAVRTLR